MRMSFRPAGRPVAYPSELVTVQVATAEDGAHALHEAYSSVFAGHRMPAWHVPAVAELLLSAPHDPGTLLRMHGHPYYKEIDGRTHPKPAALRMAGDATLSHAERMRKARWSGRAPSCRGIFHEYEKNPSAAVYGVGALAVHTSTVLTMLVEAHDALVSQPTAAADEQAARERCEELVFWIGCTTRYASVPPSKEAELMAQGYTVAEYLVHSAAGWVLHLAADYDKVQGPNAAAFASVARKARISAIAARQVIEQGVRYTLERHPQE